MPPRHIAPLRAVRIVLVHQMVSTVEVDHATWVIDPVSLRRKMILHSILLSISLRFGREAKNQCYEYQKELGDKMHGMCEKTGRGNPSRFSMKKIYFSIK